ncbi:MAG: hypothetical protein LUI08_00085 [Prevotella sp.]|nr:hypothetical protein [Prevotella sp.]
MTVVWLCFVLANLIWAISSALLAGRRGRNAVNWFFLTCFYGPIGLLFLACSRDINQDEDGEESDTLAKTMWILLAIPVIIIVMIFMAIYNSFQ